MKADEEAMPHRDEFDRAQSSVRRTVLEHAERTRSRGVPLRITAVAVGALVIFGGGVSLGNAVASPASEPATPLLATLKVACFADPASFAAFAYLNVALASDAAAGTPAANCGRVWDESSEQSALRAGALFTEQQYERGACQSGGSLNCQQTFFTPPPAIPKPVHWADCAKRGGYFVEVGYSSGTESAACAAQSLSSR